MTLRLWSIAAFVKSKLYVVYVARAGERRHFGVFELEWSWPLEASALGLDVPLRTKSGQNHVVIPSQVAESGQLTLDWPRELVAECDSPWGRHCGGSQFRIQRVGLRFECQVRDRSLRVAEISQALETVSDWIAWMTEEPLEVEPRVHVHKVPLLVNATGQLWNSMHRKLEHQGTDSRHATHQQLVEAFGKTSCGEELSLAQHLWCQARTDFSRRQDRRAVVTALSAAEVAIEHAIRRAASPSPGDQGVDEVLRGAGGIVQKRQILGLLLGEDLPAGMPSVDRLKHLAGVRNKAIHAGIWPGQTETRDAINAARDIVAAT